MRILADENIPLVQEAFASFGDVATAPGRSIGPGRLRDVELLLVRTVTQVDEALLNDSSVRFVGSPTSGFDHIDREYLQRAGIGFAYAPGSNANSVAEYIVAALLELEERIGPLPGKTIGIVGAGHVGSRVREKVEALGMAPVLNDPPLAERTGDPIYQALDAVQACDVVTFHTPLIHDGPHPTHHLADEAFLRAMKPGATLINTARGAVVDNADLNRVLADGHLAACVLDVWENEPDIDGELLQRVDIGTPHIAGYSLDGKVNGLRQVYEQAAAHFGVAEPVTTEECVPPPTEPVGGEGASGLRNIVRRVYDIRADHDRLVDAMNANPESRAAGFDKLRRDYGIRREFNTCNVARSNGDSAALDKLEALGFQILSRSRAANEGSAS